MASKKTKKAARKGASRSRATKKKAPAKKRASRPSRAGKAAKKPARKAAKKPTKKAKGSKKAAAKKRPTKRATKPAKKPARKGVTKAKSAKKPKTAARSTSQSSRPVTSATQGRPRLAAPGKTPKASIRRPEGAEELKQKIGALSSATSQIKQLKRSLNKSFYEIGQILRKIELERLYEVKGYASFEAFVDREIDLGKNLSLKIVRIVQVFLKDAALAAGMDRLSAALDALDGEAPQEGSPGSTSSGTRSAIPLHKQ